MMRVGRRGWIRSLASYRVMGGVGVSYDGIWGLVIAASVHVYSAIAPRGVRGRGKVWHR
jgi:hypothetical protein